MYPSSGACNFAVELPNWLLCSRFVVCWRFGAVGFEWCLCCRLKPATQTPLKPNRRVSSCAATVNLDKAQIFVH